jgi:hypothetical protein
MTDGRIRRGFGKAPPRRVACVRGLVIACALIASGTVAAQQPPQPPPQSQLQPAPQDAPAIAPQVAPDLAFQPGFLDALGRWLGDSKAKIDEQLKTTQDAIGGLGTQATGAAKDAAGAAQQATGALIGLPAGRVVNGRERCPVAANGAPDCTPAANALCRTKGFGSGRGLDINASQKCPAHIWWSGRSPTEAECTAETFVLRAVCQ